VTRVRTEEAEEEAEEAEEEEVKSDKNWIGLKAGQQEGQGDEWPA
jgi:hypothetical protein